MLSIAGLEQFNGQGASILLCNLFQELFLSEKIMQKLNCLHNRKKSLLYLTYTIFLISNKKFKKVSTIQDQSVEKPPTLVKSKRCLIICHHKYYSNPKYDVSGPHRVHEDQLESATHGSHATCHYKHQCDRRAARCANILIIAIYPNNKGQLTIT